MPDSRKNKPDIVHRIGCLSNRFKTAFFGNITDKYTAIIGGGFVNRMAEQAALMSDLVSTALDPIKIIQCLNIPDKKIV